MNEIVFDASVYQVRTLPTDQGIRLQLDLPEDAIAQMAMLAECRRQGIYLRVTCIATDGLAGKQHDGTREKRTLRKGE